MEFYEQNLEGYVVYNNESIPVQLKYASKYSLMVNFPDGYDFSDQTEFSSLTLKIDEENFIFNKCVLVLEANIDGYAGRLVFTDDVYNFAVLLQKKVQVNLDTYFYNLPLTLNHKNNIVRSFKDFTSNLSFDLSIYKQYFDNLDEEYKDEKQVIKDSIQKVLIASEGKKFMAFLDAKLIELEAEIKEFSNMDHEKHGFYFRKLLWNFILCSAFMTRTNLKPRGYVGDSEMMRMIYENNYWGESTFEKLMHKHPIEHPAAEAVRNRRVLIPKVLRETMQEFPNLPSRGFKVLSVASGPATELQDLLLTEDDFQKFSFSLLDQDTSALMEAARGIEKIEILKKSKAKVIYLKDSVRTMLKTSKISEKWGQFHYIYSMGLFDYLTPPVAAVLLEKLYELLLPGGQLLVGNYSVKNPSRSYMEYWCDWVLYYRTEEEFTGLLNDKTAKKTVFYENAGSQMFLQVKKEG
jgi:extracellular factor (EF) 3-hydroxypalmitic acid methyl ester biosynthesis protein